MKSMRMVGIAACVMMSGCTTMGQRATSEWPFGKETKNGVERLCATEPCSSLDALEANEKAGRFCRSIYNFYENGGSRSKQASLAMRVTGALAGSVFAITAKGSGAKAWAGVAGATNTLQPSLESTFSAALELKRQAAVAKAIETGNKNFWTNESNPTAQVAVAIQTATACSVAASSADAAVLAALSAQLPMPVNEPTSNPAAPAPINVSKGSSANETDKDK